MRVVPDAMKQIWQAGDFTGRFRPLARITVVNPHVDLFDVPIATADTSKNTPLSATDAANSQQAQMSALGGTPPTYDTYASIIFGRGGRPRELPNTQKVTWTRDTTQDVATATITFYNLAPLKIGQLPNPGDLDQRGYYSPNRGRTKYSSRWMHSVNEWAQMLVPDNILKTYEGYGFDATVIPERDPHMVQSGVWIIDTVAISATTGIITVTCSDLARILVDQIIFPPVCPLPFYPLTFAAAPIHSGVQAPKVFTYTVDSSGKHDPNHPPPDGWMGPTSPPTDVQILSSGDRLLEIAWNPPTDPLLVAPTDNSAARLQLLNVLDAASVAFVGAGNSATVQAAYAQAAAAQNAMNATIASPPQLPGLQPVPATMNATSNALQAQVDSLNTQDQNLQNQIKEHDNYIDAHKAAQAADAAAGNKGAAANEDNAINTARAQKDDLIAQQKVVRTMRDQAQANLTAVLAQLQAAANAVAAQNAAITASDSAQVAVYQQQCNNAIAAYENAVAAAQAAAVADVQMAKAALDAAQLAVANLVPVGTYGYEVTGYQLVLDGVRLPEMIQGLTGTQTRNDTATVTTTLPETAYYVPGAVTYPAGTTNPYYQITLDDAGIDASLSSMRAVTNDPINLPSDNTMALQAQLETDLTLWRTLTDVTDPNYTTTYANRQSTVESDATAVVNSINSAAAVSAYQMAFAALLAGMATRQEGYEFLATAPAGPPTNASANLGASWIAPAAHETADDSVWTVTVALGTAVDPSMLNLMQLVAYDPDPALAEADAVYGLNADGSINMNDVLVPAQTDRSTIATYQPMVADDDLSVSFTVDGTAIDTYYAPKVTAYQNYQTALATYQTDQAAYVAAQAANPNQTSVQAPAEPAVAADPPPLPGVFRVQFVVDPTSTQALRRLRATAAITTLTITRNVTRTLNGVYPVPTEYLMNGNVYSIEVVAIYQELLTPTGELAMIPNAAGVPQPPTNVLRSEISDRSDPVALLDSSGNPVLDSSGNQQVNFGRPGVASLPLVVPGSIAVNVDAQAEVVPGDIDFAWVNAGGAFPEAVTFCLLAYKLDGSKLSFFVHMPAGTPANGRSQFSTGDALHNLNAWNFICFAAADPSATAVEGFPGTADFTPPIGPGDIYFASTTLINTAAQGGDGGFFGAPVHGAPAHDPGPAPTAPTIQVSTVNLSNTLTLTSTDVTASVSSVDVGQSNGSYAPGGTRSVPVVKQPLSLHLSDTSNTYYKNGDKDASESGHFPHDALDTSPATFWLSIGNERNDQGYSYEWFEAALDNVTLVGINFDTVKTGYHCYVSVFASGHWIQHHDGDTIPYDPKNPLSHNGANIPFCETYNQGGSETGNQVIFQSPIPNAQRVRVTFHNLQYFDEGPYHYRAGLRGISAFSSSGGGTATSPGVSTAGTPGEMQTTVTTNSSSNTRVVTTDDTVTVSTSIPAPTVVGPPQDDDGADDITSYTDYVPPKIIPGAGVNPGQYSDYTDIVKLLLAWGGLFWPEHAQQELSDGTFRHFPFGVGQYGLENVDPALGAEGSGRVWGDFMDTGTSGPAPIPVAQWDKKTLMDGIAVVREIIGFLFFIDEEGAAVWRAPNVYSIGNWLNDRSADISPRTNDIIEIDEEIALTDLTATLDYKNVREQVFVATVNGNVGALVDGYNPNPIGLRRVAGWTDQYFSSEAECRTMADLITIRQLFTYRTDSVVIPGYPAIQIDDQVRLIERVTAEGYLHYIGGIQNSLDHESGVWTYTLSTQWLGEDPLNVWAFNTTDLTAETQTYLAALKIPAGSAVATTSGTDVSGTAALGNA